MTTAPPAAPTCTSCRHLRPEYAQAVHAGECRRFPPTPDLARRATWPLVRADAGCGEHAVA